MIIEGFRYAAVAAGIRKADRLDLGLIHSDTSATAAGVFTTNRVKAAPVLLGMDRLRGGRAQAILVNSGIANACTGSPGMEAAVACSALAAEALGISEDLVQVSSTGVIGEQLNPERFAAAMPGLVDRLRPDGYGDVASAMMTTDTVPKTAGRTMTVYGETITIFGVAKGAGMIRPDMATMLCFVMTDAAIAAPDLKKALAGAVQESFNRITVDGDTSTNDTVLILANGRAGNEEIASGTLAMAVFREALAGLLKELALRIVEDGEGATKKVTIRVTGAVDRPQARLAAETVANSALVKTAFFGEDANWGRIIAALGRSGAEFDPDRVSIGFDDVVLVEKGLGTGTGAEAAAATILKQPAFTVFLDLAAGAAGYEVYTCDFSVDYVRINADYRT